jgi:predicted PurR-regulated permease PerM
VILLSIAAGTALFGFAGTVLAVPVTATVISSIAALRGEVDPSSPAVATPEAAAPGRSPDP